MTTYLAAKQGLSFRDCRGHVGKVNYYYLWDSAVAASAGLVAARAAITNINSAIEGLTNALVVGVTGINSLPLNPLDYGATTDYANAETKARLYYQSQTVATGVVTSYGTIHIDIPAPLVTMFLADKETVNPAFAAVATLTAALQAVDAHAGQACNKQGAYFGAFIGGLLIRRKLQRKLTLYSKSSNLDEPEE
jgi:hypothetical protein